jgi:uncharacterized protein (DUF3084 family)
MLEKIKSNIQLIIGGLVAILSLAFLFERQKRKEAEAIADNKEVLDELNKGDKQKASNDGQLQAEEVKREEIRKEAEDAKADDSSDATDFLRKR